MTAHMEFWIGFFGTIITSIVVGKLSCRRELEYLRNFRDNRETLDRIETNIRKMGKP